MKTSKQLRLACLVALSLLLVSSAFVFSAAAAGKPSGGASTQNASTRAQRRKATARKRRARRTTPVAKEIPKTFSRHVFSGGTDVQGEPEAQAPAGDEPPPTPAPTPAPKKTIVAGGVLNGKAISKPAPEYPAIAKAAGASGTVVVQIVVGEDGQVVSASAVSGHPLLQQAAVAAARRARFAPTTLSGQPVKVSGVITYNFVLNPPTPY